jgi:hypothetical protein
MMDRIPRPSHSTEKHELKDKPTRLSLHTIMLSSNNPKVSQSFMGVIEVRNSNGTIVSLQFQKETLNVNGETELGVSWTADKAKIYQIGAFV